VWATIRTLRLFSKTLIRIAVALEGMLTLYRLELASRNIISIDASLRDEVEVFYGSTEPE
jgi:hypothetical protein